MTFRYSQWGSSKTTDGLEGLWATPAKREGQMRYEPAKERNLFPGEIACADIMSGNQTDPVL